METHANHLHHSPKSGWKHYALEFIMLFLAVSAGFFAENLRTHFVEEDQARQYILSFYEDLKSDTVRISINSAFAAGKIQGLSNLANCYDTVLKNRKCATCMLDLIKNSVFNRPFYITDRTLKQLENAGGFRLLQREDADSIIRYEKRVNQLMDFQSTMFQEAQDDVRSTYNQLFDFRASQQMLQMQPTETLNTFNSNVNMPLFITDDKMLLNKYFNELLLYDRVTITQQTILMQVRINEIRLIRFFRNKYHFE